MLKTDGMDPMRLPQLPPGSPGAACHSGTEMPHDNAATAMQQPADGFKDASNTRSTATTVPQLPCPAGPVAAVAGAFLTASSRSGSQAAEFTAADWFSEEHRDPMLHVLHGDQQQLTSEQAGLPSYLAVPLPVHAAGQRASDALGVPHSIWVTAPETASTVGPLPTQISEEACTSGKTEHKQRLGS